MKKLFTLFLILTIASFCLVGCGNESDESSIVFALDPVESYDNVSIYLPENNEETSKTENSLPQQEQSGFVVKEKKFVYGDCNVALLNIENKTEKNYTLTVNGTYYDKSGNVIKTETQTFKDFVSGYQGYFLFHPETAFDRFAYTLTYTDFLGKPRLSNIKLLQWDTKTAFFMVWQEQLIELAGIDDTMYNTLSTNYKFINENDIPLHIKRVMLAIDSNGEIISIKPFGYEEVAAHGLGGGTFRLYHTLDDLTTNPKTWPAKLQGELDLIMIPLDALTKEEYRELF